jgi:hypothetical protein
MCKENRALLTENEVLDLLCEYLMRSRDIERQEGVVRQYQSALMCSYERITTNCSYVQPKWRP